MTVRLFCENSVYHNRKSTQSFDTRDRAVCGAKDFLRNHRKWFRVKAARAYLSVRLKINPSTLLLLPSTPPSPTPLTLSWWSDKNSNNPEAESGILTMAGAHNWQEPLTAPSCPSQAPFEPLSPLQLPPKPHLTAPQAPRPASGQKVAEIGKIICCWCTVAEVCLEWDKESLPCQEFCACAVRALRARSARPRLQSRTGTSAPLSRTGTSSCPLACSHSTVPATPSCYPCASG